MQCPKFASVNGHLESEFYQIQDQDVIQILNYYTLDQLFTFMDVSPEGTILVNNEAADGATKIYENFKVTWQEQPAYKDLPEETVSEPEHSAEEKEESGEAVMPAENGNAQTIVVIANDKTYTLSGKDRYVFVEIFDVMHFDTSKVQGSELVMLLNDRKAEHFDELKNGDIIKIFWRN